MNTRIPKIKITTVDELCNDESVTFPTLDNYVYTTPERINFIVDPITNEFITYKQHWNRYYDKQSRYEPQYPEEIIRYKQRLENLENDKKHYKYVNIVNNFCDKFNLFLCCSQEDSRYKLKINYTKNGYGIFTTSSNKDYLLRGIIAFSNISIIDCYFNMYTYLILLKLYKEKYIGIEGNKDFSKLDFICDCSKELKK